MPAPTGVLLLTFGSATTSDDVEPYLRSVRRGSDPTPEVVAEFRSRYDQIGRSPLVDITLNQAMALQALLDERHPGGYIVGVGMRHSDPFIAAAVAGLAARGATRVLGVVMSPQYSPVIMAGYEQELMAAADERRMAATIARPWYLVDEFVQTIADAISAELREFPEDGRDAVPVIFTAHSLPKSVVERDQNYLDQIRTTVEAVVARIGLAPGRWQFAYQSAGHTPEPWLTPDFKDLLPGLRAAGHREVLVVPTQFLADHLEILYDIDVAGQAEAAEQGMGFRRIAMPNVSPTFIAALAAVVERDTAPVAS